MRTKITRTRATYTIRKDSNVVRNGESLYKKKGEDKITWKIGDETVVHRWDDRALEWVRS